MAGETRGIRIAGLGGQGVVLAGMILGHAAVHEGLYAAGSSSYGAQSRGSVCKAEVVISRTPIDYPHVELADIFAAMSQEGYDAYMSETADAGSIFYDAGLVLNPRSDRGAKPFDVTAVAIKELKDKQAANIIWVGILARAIPWLGGDGLEQAVREHIPPRLLDLNLRALRLGLEILD